MSLIIIYKFATWRTGKVLDFSAKFGACEVRVQVPDGFYL